MTDGDPGVGRVTSVAFDGSAFDAFIFQGGGTKGIFYSGAIRRLDEAGLLQHVKCFAGTSAGASTATLLAFGHSGAEMEDLMLNWPWKRALDGAGGPCGVCRGSFRLACSYGYYKGDAMTDHLDEVIAKKRANKERLCTFQQLYDEFGIELRLGASNIVSGQFEFLDRYSWPNMPVCVGVRASCSIPLAFVPTQYEDAVFVDGCIEGNLPISAFPDKRILAFHLRAEPGPNPMSSSGAFFGSIADMLMNSSQRKHGVNVQSFAFDAMELRNEKNVDILKIDCGSHGLLETKLKKPQIEEMLKSGREAASLYLSHSSFFLSRPATPLHTLSHPTPLPESLALGGEDDVVRALEALRVSLSGGDSPGSGLDALRVIEAKLRGNVGSPKAVSASQATTATGRPSEPISMCPSSTGSEER